MLKKQPILYNIKKFIDGERFTDMADEVKRWGKKWRVKDGYHEVNTTFGHEGEPITFIVLDGQETGFSKYCDEFSLLLSQMHPQTKPEPFIIDWLLYIVCNCVSAPHEIYLIWQCRDSHSDRIGKPQLRVFGQWHSSLPALRAELPHKQVETWLNSQNMPPLSNGGEN